MKIKDFLAFFLYFILIRIIEYGILNVIYWILIVPFYAYADMRFIDIFMYFVLIICIILGLFPFYMLINWFSEGMLKEMKKEVGVSVDVFTYIILFVFFIFQGEEKTIFGTLVLFVFIAGCRYLTKRTLKWLIDDYNKGHKEKFVATEGEE